MSFLPQRPKAATAPRYQPASQPQSEEERLAAAQQEAERQAAIRAGIERRAAEAAERKQREDAYEFAGSLDGFLEWVESERATALAEVGGRFLSRANKKAEERRAWGRSHEEGLRERAAHEAYQAFVKNAVAHYRAWVASGGDPTPFAIPPDGGISDIDSLQELCRLGHHSISNRAPCIEHQALLFQNEEDGGGLVENDEGDQVPADPRYRYSPNYTSHPQHWIIGQDTHCIVPTSLSASGREPFARKWRDSVHHFRDQAVAVFLPPGEPLCWAVWSDRKMSPSAHPLGGGSNYYGLLSGSQEDRFQRVEYPWLVPRGGGIYLPDPHAALVTTSAVERAQNAPKDAQLVTGLAGLDGLFRGGVGIPFGTRVLLTGDPQNCKTHCLLEIGETAAAGGWYVLWVSKDDDPTLIDIRRLQRAGRKPVSGAEFARAARLPGRFGAPR